MDLKGLWNDLDDDSKTLTGIIIVVAGIVGLDSITSSIEKMSLRVKTLQDKVYESGKTWPEVIDTFGDTLEAFGPLIPSDIKDAIKRVTKGKSLDEIADYLQKLSVYAKLYERFAGEFTRNLTSRGFDAIKTSKYLPVTKF